MSGREKKVERNQEAGKGEKKLYKGENIVIGIAQEKNMKTREDREVKSPKKNKRKSFERDKSRKEDNTYLGEKRMM